MGERQLFVTISFSTPHTSSADTEIVLRRDFSEKKQSLLAQATITNFETHDQALSDYRVSITFTVNIPAPGWLPPLFLTWIAIQTVSQFSRQLDASQFKFIQRESVQYGGYITSLNDL